MNNDDYNLKFDESKLYEHFSDFHGTQILWVNTLDPDIFLKAGQEFYDLLSKKVDPDGFVKAIFVADKLPSLSAIFRFVEHSPTSNNVKWTAVAGIEPGESEVLEKILPIVNYGLGLSREKDKFKVRVFKNEYKNNLKEVIDWLNHVTEEQKQNLKK